MYVVSPPAGKHLFPREIVDADDAFGFKRRDLN